jgi:hypothetical protein
MSMPTPVKVRPLTAGVPAASGRVPGRLVSAQHAVAVLMGILVLASAAVLVPLSNLARQPLTLTGSSVYVLILAFGLVGFVLSWRQPRNSIGWILLWVGLLFILSGEGGLYDWFDYRLHNGSLPLGLVAVLFEVLWVPQVLILPLPVLLFPDGRLPSFRWRWVLWSYLALGALFASVYLGLLVNRVILQPHIRVTSSGFAALAHPPGPVELSGALLLLLFLVYWLTWVIRLVLGYRRSSGERRQQLKWFLGGAAIAGIGFAGSISTSSNSSAIGQAIQFFSGLAWAALPIGLGVGVLKYHLYDIDRVISRTLSYAIVTGLLIGIYVGLVTLATKVLPFSSPLGVAVSTLTAAALFNPLRKRVQRLVDRRFNRARYDAESIVSAFAQRVRDDVDLQVVGTEFVRAVQRSVEPAHVSLWLRPTGSRGLDRQRIG